MITERKVPNLADFKDLFGSPPVLRTENREHYEEMFSRMTECFKPKDVLEQTLIKHLVDAMWDIKRYTRHRTVAIERWFRQSLAFQAQRTKLQDQRRKSLAYDAAERASQSPADVARLIELQNTVEAGVSDVDEILERTPTELEHNRALEKGIVFHEQLEKWITSATARFNNVLEQFELYREGLGHRLRQAAEEILDAEYEEISTQPEQFAAPALAPSNEDRNELGTQDSSESQQ